MLFSAKLLPRHVKGRGYDRIHVIILVLTKASSKDDALLFVCQGTVLLIELTVLFVIYRIIGLVPGLPLGAVLPGYDGLGKVMALLILSELEPLVLYDTGPGRLPVRVVDGSIALEVGLVQDLRLKAHAAILKGPQLIVKVRILR